MVLPALVPLDPADPDPVPVPVPVPVLVGPPPVLDVAPVPEEDDAGPVVPPTDGTRCNPRQPPAASARAGAHPNSSHRAWPRARPAPGAWAATPPHGGSSVNLGPPAMIPW